MILKQKQGGKRKEFEIQNNSTLRVKEKESGELKEWTVNLPGSRLWFIFLR